MRQMHDRILSYIAYNILLVLFPISHCYYFSLFLSQERILSDTIQLDLQKLPSEATSQYHIHVI